MPGGFIVPTLPTSTGSGNLVLATSPTLTTPVLGTATVTAIKVAGVQVLGAQQAAIANPGVLLVDALTGVTSILTALRAHGLIAP